MTKKSTRSPVVRSNIGRVIAERVLTISGVKDKTVTLSLGIPYRVDGDRWDCPFSIEGLTPKPIVGSERGGDSLQALLIAVAGIRRHLMLSGATFEWDGNSLLGGDCGAIPQFLRIGMGEEFYRRIDAAINRETERTRKFRAPIMRQWLVEAGISTERSPRK